MDLVEIRKKSKKKQTAKKAVETVPDHVQVALQTPATARSGKGPGVPPDRAEQLTEENSTKPLVTTNIPPTGQTPTGLDVLDALFATTPDMILATEEIYLQGLQGNSTKDDGGQQQWLTFNLGKEQYALDITFVREIIKPREITDIPRVPGFILGVVSLRGVIVPIYDLCRRLNLGQVETDNRSRIVVCEQGDRIAGLLVDNITQVVRFSTGEIEPPPAILSGLDRELVEGVGRVQGKMIILLDLPSVLDVELK
jgi:purine-binding chemotaxis protein CheW